MEETAKKCGKCDTVWKDSWLPNDSDKNECPFCGEQLIEKECVKTQLPKIKRKNLGWQKAASIKLISRLESDVREIDWTIFKKESYFNLLRKRSNLIAKINTKLESILDRELHKNGKRDINDM